MAEQRSVPLSQAISAPVLFLRSSLYQLGLVLSTLTWAPLVLLTFPLSYRTRYRFARLWAHFNIWWLQKTCNLGYRIRGRENLPSGAAVVLVKHQSTWETLLLQRLFCPQVWVLKRELLWIPFFGWALALLRPIAIDRSLGRTAMRQILRQGNERLKQGISVVIFPEGTRVPPGQRGRYGIGGPWLAAHSGYPVIPIAHNAGEFWPRHSFIKRPGLIEVVIGPAIQVQGRSAQEVKALTETWIEETMEVIQHGSAASSHPDKGPSRNRE